ncbi:hypothetical protein [Pseudomonas sp.]|jgi:recombination protein RecA|uniref:hypothetical protein n=1 Tax=Pseudomonas sp. TaxID=306 RepID=UPI0037C9414A
MDENKKRALAAALGQIEKQFGKGAVMRMGDHDRQAIPAISTGSLGLDIALGIGGLPKGRIVEIYYSRQFNRFMLVKDLFQQAYRSVITQEPVQIAA